MGEGAGTGHQSGPHGFNFQDLCDGRKNQTPANCPLTISKCAYHIEITIKGPQFKIFDVIESYGPQVQRDTSLMTLRTSFGEGLWSGFCSGPSLCPFMYV